MIAATLPATLRHRVLAFALAQLLLLTQQLGVQHRASHGLLSAALPASSSATSSPPARVAAGLPAGTLGGPAANDPGPPDSGPTDAQCQVCLLLAALALAALPALLRWRGLALPSPAPLAPPALPCAAAPSQPYQARAPPR